MFSFLFRKWVKDSRGKSIKCFWCVHLGAFKCYCGFMVLVLYKWFAHFLSWVLPLRLHRCYYSTLSSDWWRLNLQPQRSPFKLRAVKTLCMFLTSILQFPCVLIRLLLVLLLVDVMSLARFILKWGNSIHIFTVCFPTSETKPTLSYQKNAVFPPSPGAKTLEGSDDSWSPLVLFICWMHLQPS